MCREVLSSFSDVLQDTYDGLSPETNYATMAGRSADDKAIRNLLDMEGACTTRALPSAGCD